SPDHRVAVAEERDERPVEAAHADVSQRLRCRRAIPWIQRAEERLQRLGGGEDAVDTGVANERRGSGSANGGNVRTVEKRQRGGNRFLLLEGAYGDDRRRAYLRHVIRQQSAHVLARRLGPRNAELFGRRRAHRRIVVAEEVPQLRREVA